MASKRTTRSAVEERASKGERSYEDDQERGGDGMSGKPDTMARASLQPILLASCSIA